MLKSKKEIKEAIVIFIIYIMTLVILPNLVLHIMNKYEEHCAKEQIVEERNNIIETIKCNTLKMKKHSIVAITTEVSGTADVTTKTATIVPIVLTVPTVPTPPLSVETVKEKYASVISYDMDVTQLTGATEEEFTLLMNSITQDDENNFYAQNSSIIYDICNKYSINEIFFCGIISAESWWGTAGNAVSHNNYTGMMGSDGLSYYSSTYENLDATASNLANNYLTETGSCYYGNRISDVAICYCDSSWTDLVWGRMSEIIY